MKKTVLLVFSLIISYLNYSQTLRGFTLEQSNTIRTTIQNSISPLGLQIGNISRDLKNLETRILNLEQAGFKVDTRYFSLVKSKSGLTDSLVFKADSLVKTSQYSETIKLISSLQKELTELKDSQSLLVTKEQLKELLQILIENL